MREVAMNYFHGVEGYNCCQAILKTFQRDHSVTEEAISLSKRHGGGRAPENVCGALYALHMMLPDEKKSMTAAFEAIVGSHTCRDIRGKKLLSCRECVGVASDVLTQSRSN